MNIRTKAQRQELIEKFLAASRRVSDAVVQCEYGSFGGLGMAAQTGGASGPFTPLPQDDPDSSVAAGAASSAGPEEESKDPDSDGTTAFSLSGPGHSHSHSHTLNRHPLPAPLSRGAARSQRQVMADKAAEIERLLCGDAEMPPPPLNGAAATGGFALPPPEVLKVHLSLTEFSQLFVVRIHSPPSSPFPPCLFAPLCACVFPLLLFLRASLLRCARVCAGTVP